jgi:hypothetical protein
MPKELFSWKEGAYLIGSRAHAVVWINTGHDFYLFDPNQGTFRLTEEDTHKLKNLLKGWFSKKPSVVL